ncbi:hypothetical protein JL722_8529 [Aureococcus anophagefferens]|nr:hypothetical protein JL722_8529 [Aureococcus anophagefferens]
MSSDEDSYGSRSDRSESPGRGSRRGASGDDGGRGRRPSSSPGSAQNRARDDAAPLWGRGVVRGVAADGLARGRARSAGSAAAAARRRSPGDGAVNLVTPATRAGADRARWWDDAGMNCEDDGEAEVAVVSGGATPAAPVRTTDPRVVVKLRLGCGNWGMGVPDDPSEGEAVRGARRARDLDLGDEPRSKPAALGAADRRLIAKLRPGCEGWGMGVPYDPSKASEDETSAPRPRDGNGDVVMDDAGDSGDAGDSASARTASGTSGSGRGGEAQAAPPPAGLGRVGGAGTRLWFAVPADGELDEPGAPVVALPGMGKVKVLVPRPAKATGSPSRATWYFPGAPAPRRVHIKSSTRLQCGASAARPVAVGSFEFHSSGPAELVLESLGGAAAAGPPSDQARRRRLSRASSRRAVPASHEVAWAVPRDGGFGGFGGFEDPGSGGFADPGSGDDSIGGDGDAIWATDRLAELGLALKLHDVELWQMFDLNADEADTRGFVETVLPAGDAREKFLQSLFERRRQRRAVRRAAPPSSGAEAASASLPATPVGVASLLPARDGDPPELVIDLFPAWDADMEYVPRGRDLGLADRGDGSAMDLSGEPGDSSGSKASPGAALQVATLDGGSGGEGDFGEDLGFADRGGGYGAALAAATRRGPGGLSGGFGGGSGGGTPGLVGGEAPRAAGHPPESSPGADLSRGSAARRRRDGPLRRLERAADRRRRGPAMASADGPSLGPDLGGLSDGSGGGPGHRAGARALDEAVDDALDGTVASRTRLGEGRLRRCDNYVESDGDGSSGEEFFVDKRTRGDDDGSESEDEASGILADRGGRGVSGSGSGASFASGLKGKSVTSAASVELDEGSGDSRDGGEDGGGEEGSLDLTRSSAPSRPTTRKSSCADKNPLRREDLLDDLFRSSYLDSRVLNEFCRAANAPMSNIPKVAVKALVKHFDDNPGSVIVSTLNVETKLKHYAMEMKERAADREKAEKAEAEEKAAREQERGRVPFKSIAAELGTGAEALTPGDVADIVRRLAPEFDGVKGSLGVFGSARALEPTDQEMSLNSEDLAHAELAQAPQAAGCGVKATPGSAAITEAQRVTVERILSGSSELTGTFTLSFDGAETEAIDVDASAEDVKAYLEDLSTLSVVEVSRNTTSSWGAAEWLVTFLSEAGDLPLMRATSGRLSYDSATPAAYVETVLPGGAPLRDLTAARKREGEDIFYTELFEYDEDGEYNPAQYEIQKLVFDAGYSGDYTISLNQSSRADGVNDKTAALSSGCTAYQMKVALEALDNIEAVDVSRNGSSATGLSSTDTEFVEDTQSIHVKTSTDDDVARSSGPSITSSGVAEDPVAGCLVRQGPALLHARLGDGTVTTSLDLTSATNAEVEAALEALDGVYDVSVSDGTADSGSFTGNAWDVTFHSPVGDVKGDSGLAGTYTVAYEGSYSADIAYEATAADVKSLLEDLATIDEAHRRVEGSYGQADWLVTFRSELGDLDLLDCDASLTTGSDAACAADEIVAGDSDSLTGNTPTVHTEEKVAGLPSYTGMFTPAATGDYDVVVRQLTQGGLSAEYFDNQWLQGDPTVERIDAAINFDWGTGALTPYGRDYVSARWSGKLKASYNEIYTIFCRADDGIRLYVDHELSSNAFFHAAHIVASPFATTVVPGRADYPFTTAEGGSLTAAVAGVRQTFVVTTKDAMGNVRISEAEQDDFADKLVVDIVGPTILAGSVTYIGDGQYSIAYMPLKSGDYALHVKTGGSDIYCGLGDSDACSPFALDVAPGAATASEAESAPAPRMDFLVESAAGDTGSFAIAAKDAYSNDLRTGGDEFSVLLTHREDADVQYRAYITDYNNGSYLATYTVPFAGAYDVYPLLVGARTTAAYKSPDYCDHAQPILEVVHGPLHAPTSSVIGPGVTEAMISGVKSKLTVQARDAFGNLRRGDDTTHFQYGYYGGETDQMGASDYFLVVFQHMTMDYAVTTSTAIQTVRIGNALDEGARRRPRESETREGERSGNLFEGRFVRAARRRELGRHGAGVDADCCVAAIAAPSPARGAGPPEPTDFAAGFGADHEYTITFLSDLDAWASDSLKVLSPEDGNGAAVAEVNISRPAAGGHYPVDFILGYVGEYELSVTSSGRHVEGSPFEVDCEHGVATSGATTVASDNINEAVAGDTIVLDVHARDHRQHEVQIVAVAAQAVDTVPEVQRVHVGSSAFTLTFRGATTSSFALGGTEATLEGLIEDLPTITGGVTVHEVTKGDAPYVREIQTFYCDATSGNLAVDFRDYDTTAGNTVAEMVYVEFLELTGDLPALEYNASSTALASSIVAYSGGNYGQVDGVHPVWGTFTLEFGGWTSDPIRADASADELRDSLEALPSIGDVSVYKTTIGQCLDQLDRQIFPNASRLSAAPTVRVTEAIKGTTGNLVTSSGGDEIIEYSATHQQHTDVGIDMYETQRLRCATQSGGNFSPPGLTVTGGNANGDICCTDATASTCAWVSVAFVGNFGTLPMLEFGEEQGVDLEIEEIVKGIDSLEYAGDGLYRLAVTPTVSGNYTFTLRISPQFFGGANATTDVRATASATAWAGPLDAGPGSHFAVDLNGTGFEGGGREGDRSLVAGAVDDKYVPNTDGLYEASYTPELAGPHVLEVELTQPGGLLATYYAQMDFAVSLVLDGETLIDTMDASGSLVDVASANFTATKNELYALEISFVEEIDGAAISFEWTVGGAQAVVPASALYYTRHAKLSPETVVVYPDRIAAATTAAEGDGTLACVALEECSFVVTATDADGNYRVNTGADELVVEILGVGDWAGEGRTNEYDSYGVIEVDEVTDVNVAWDYVGTASVYNNVSKLYNLSGAFETLLRGDVLSIGDGDLQDASPEFIAIGSGAFYLNDTVGADERSVPLADVWRGNDAHRVRVYKGAYAGDTARHTISYTPYVRGTYDLDVRVKKTEEVQQVVVSVGAGLCAGKKLAGNFTLSLTAPDKFGVVATETTPPIAYDATPQDVEDALITLSQVWACNVSGYNSAPKNGSKFRVEFSGVYPLVGADFPLLVPDTTDLTGNRAAVDVYEVVRGVPEASIAGAPFPLVVSPNDASSAWSTAYGRGLVQGVAGETSSFTIIAKDEWGNTRFDAQDESKFSVLAFVEMTTPGADGWSRKNSDGLVASTATAVNGSVAYVGDGEYVVSYTPVASGPTTVAVVLQDAVEEQVVSWNATAPDDAVKDGGGVVFSIAGSASDEVAWDSEASDVAAALSALGWGAVEVSRGIARGTDDLSKYDAAALRGLQIDSVNYVYSVTFSDYVGDVPPIEAHFPLDANFIDYASASVAEVVKGSWGVVKASESKITATPWVNEALVREKQVVRLVGSGSYDGNFTLEFKDAETGMIPVNASAAQMKQALEVLETVGEVDVTRFGELGAGALGYEWVVTFGKGRGTETDMTNLGDQPALIARNSTLTGGKITVYAPPCPAAVSAPNCTAVDAAGVAGRDGLTTGFFERESGFVIEARDAFGNLNPYGPRAETQIVDVFGNASDAVNHTGSAFSISFLGETVAIPYGAGIADVEVAIEGLPDVGAVSVSTTSAHDIISGCVANATFGLSVIDPSCDLSAYFEVGDWIRVGRNMSTTQVFTVVHMQAVSPYALTLSSQWLGDDDGELKIYEHGAGLKGHRAAYRYVVTFDTLLGDLPTMAATPSSIKFTTAVTYCERYRYQTIKTSDNNANATAGDMINGTFMLEYRGASTRQLPHDVTMSALETALEDDLPGVYSASVLERHGPFARNEYKWLVRLDSVVDDAPELLYAEGYLLSGGDAAVAGRLGAQFVARLSGPEAVNANVSYRSHGFYDATYGTPVVGSYLVDVSATESGGLVGTYFNNRWLYGDSVLTRVDHSIDFEFDEEDAITETGKDHVSVRWTGFLRPSFDERFTFHAQVNDGARLFVDGELLFDAFENEVEDAAGYAEFSGTTSAPLLAGALVDVTMEWRETTGNAVARLLWSSDSQPYGLVPSSRLFHHASDAVISSPFVYAPEAVKASTPLDVELSRNEWDEIVVTWDAPANDGGEPIADYKVEWWSAVDGDYGVPEVQTLRVPKGSDRGTFYLYSPGGFRYPWALPYDVAAQDLEEALEFCYDVGDVSVKQPYATDDGYVQYEISFDTNVGNFGPISVDAAGFVPEVCHSKYRLGRGCLNVTNGTAAILGSSTDAPLRPRTRPEEVQVERVPDEEAQLKVQWLTPRWPYDRQSLVTAFVVEYSETEDFAESVSTTLSKAACASPRLLFDSAVGEAGVWMQHTLDDLEPGTYYYVRAAAVNDAGVGAFGVAATTAAAIADKLTDGAVGLATLAHDGGVSVSDAATSLSVSWAPPASDNGYDVTAYGVEWWRGSGVDEVEVVQIDAVALNVTGTFTLSYEGAVTGHLPCDVSAADMEDALEALDTLRDVHVERAVDGGANFSWTVTFLTEWPDATDSRLVIDDAGLYSVNSTVRARVGYGLRPDLPGHRFTLSRTASAYDWMDIDGGIYQVASVNAQANKITLTEVFSTGPSGAYSAQVGVTVPGSPPPHYDYVEVAPSLLSSSGRYSYVIPDLVSGEAYTVRVSSITALGAAQPRYTQPRSLAPPRQVPDVPINTHLLVYGGTSLRVLFNHPASDGGSSVTRYRIEWDTSSEFDSFDGSPLGSNTVLVDPTSGSYDDCTLSYCGYTIGSLATGKNYTARVFAANAYGYSTTSAIPEPLFEAPKKPPSPPETLGLFAVSRTSLQVAFGDSADEGGADVTHAKLEWDGVGPAAAAAGGSSSLYSHNEVQRITTASKYRDLEGTFRVAFRGHTTGQLDHDCTSDDMAAALEALAPVGDVTVTREEVGYGLAWYVTFEAAAGDDDWLGDLPQLTVSAVDDDLAFNFSTYESLVSASLTGGDTLTTMTGTDASIAADTLVDRYDGFCIQTVYTYAQNATLLGTFALKYDSEDGVVATQYLEAGATAASVKAALEAIGTGELFVGATQAAMGKEYTIVFLERLGPVPPLTFDASRLYGGQNRYATTGITVAVTVAGRLPAMDSPLRGEAEVELDTLDVDSLGRYVYELEDLVAGEPYSVSVSLYNGVRSTYGLATHSTPASLVPAAPPGPPRSVSAVALSDGSLNRVEFECADGPLVGSFTLTFNGVATGPVPAGASADRVRSALEALATVGEVSVSLASSDDSASYQIAFRTNVKGGSPPFDEGTVGIYTLPLGSVDVVPVAEVQVVEVGAKAEDVNGYFYLSYGAAVSDAIPADATAAEMDAALDELKTLGPVTVSRATKTHRTTEPLQDPSYVWSVTFDAALGDVPSLLVYAGTGLTQEVIGAHGHLEGSAPFGNVSELVKGGLPRVSVAGPESLALSWAPPAATGGAAVSHYLIQYDLDTSFDESTGASRVPLAELAWDDNAGRWAYAFRLKVEARERVDSTPTIAAGSTADAVAQAIMDLPDVATGAILVRRWDMSSWTDSTGMGTHWSGTKYAYEIEFGNDRDAVLALTGVDDEVQASNVTQFVTPAGDAYGIAPAYREPSAPTAVLLSSVSRSNLGVSWSAPDLTGGSEVLKYLVEWDSDRDFSTLRDMDSSFGSVAAATAGAVVVNATKSEAESRRSEFQYQITGLVMGRSYWVRVSAYNDYMGYGDAASSEPASAAPADQLLGAPSKFRANLSDTEMPDRLLLTFQQPVLDGNGFDIGTGADYTPNKATAYRIEWSASSSFPAAETSYYDWRAIEDDDQDLECEGDCTIDLGAEVQSVRVFSDSDSPLTNGSYKLIYAGPSSPTTRLIVTPGSARAEYVNVSKDVDSATVANAADVIRTGDFVRLGGVDGKLYYVNQTTSGNCTLHEPYSTGLGSYVDSHTAAAEIEAFVVTPPETCIPYDATPAEMLDHLREQMDDLPFEETLVVSRDSNTSVDSGYRYRVTFSGGAFSAQPVAELEVVSRLTAATHGLADICANFTKAQSIGSNVSVRTIQVVHSVTTDIDSDALAPGAPYYLRLAAVNDVGVGSYAAPSIDGKHDTLGAIAPSAPPGLPTNVKVFAEKESATSLLVTWETVDDDHGAEITGWRVEYANASYSETYDNDWHKGFFFKEADADARSFLLDNLTAGTTYANGPEGFAGPDGFTATSVVTSWKNGGNRGDEVDKFLVEWSMDDQFAGDSYQSKIVQNNRTSEPNVEQTMEAVPMKSSDAPYAPSLEALDEDAGEYTVQDVGSQLLVKWTVPVNDSVDIYGNGGDTITSYLVEYSKEPWDDFVPVIQRLQVASNAPGGVLGGTIRLSLNTTDDSNAAVKSFATSSQIFVGNATAYDVKIALENMENVGEVEVTGTVSGSGDAHTYDITFVDVVGNMSLLQPYAEGVTRGVNDISFDPNLFNITELRNATVPYGAERPARPGALAPGGADGVPTLEASSDQTLVVQIGAPEFDGGDPVVYNVIQWDTSQDFTSDDGEPLGSATVAASKWLCADCVKGFDVDTHVFNYTGKNDDPRELASGAAIYVTFPDDGLTYMFTVKSGDLYAPNKNLIYVEDSHQRVLSYAPMDAELRVVGASYSIDGLVPGLEYYVRVASENAIKGQGDFLRTAPPSAIPVGTPSAAGTVETAVASAHAVDVSWTASHVAGGAVSGYRVEAMTAQAIPSALGSLYGLAEVQKVSTYWTYDADEGDGYTTAYANNATDGSFTLAFGAVDRARCPAP